MTSSTSRSTIGLRWWRSAGIATIAVGLAAATLPAYADNASATLTGVVTGVDGGLDTHAVVQVSPEGGGSVQRADVAADGTFEIDDIDPGRYYVTSYDTRDNVDAVYSGASWDGTQSVPGSGEAVAISAGTTDITLELPFLRGVVVTAVDEAGTPLPNIPLWIQYYEGGAWRDLAHDAPITGADGRGFVGAALSDTVRFCLRDVNYTPENRPQLRYHTACYGGGDDIEGATTVTLAPDDRKIEVEIVMAVAGRSIWHEFPVVHGEAEVGGTLTVEPQRWEPTSVALSYEWGTYENAGFVVIPGATGRTFVPTADLDGVRLAVRITGSADGYVSTTAVVSAGTIGDLAPALASFELSGTAVPGGTVTAEIGATTPAEVNEEVTWYADGVRVDGAWGHELAVTDELAGATISALLRVYVFDPEGSSEYVADRYAFATLETPVITPGSVAIDGPLLPQLKDSLLARVSGWSSDVTISYQWYRDGSPIPGATRSFYIIGRADNGAQLSVEVTATGEGAAPVSVMSDKTHRVGLGGIIGPPGGRNPGV